VFVSRVIKSGKVIVSNHRSDPRGSRASTRPSPGAVWAPWWRWPLSVDNTRESVLLFLAAARSRRDQRLKSCACCARCPATFSFRRFNTCKQDTRVTFSSRHFDSQTGACQALACFCERVAAASSAIRPGRRSRYAVAIIDIERLSLINELVSAAATGDLLLQHVADRLKRRFKQSECIAHFGGGNPLR